MTFLSDFSLVSHVVGRFLMVSHAFSHRVSRLRLLWLALTVVVNIHVCARRESFSCGFVHVFTCLRVYVFACLIWTGQFLDGFVFFD